MSSVKPLCKSTELKRCIATDRRWKRKQASRSSPGRLPNLRPSSLRNSKNGELKAPKFSIENSYSAQIEISSSQRRWCSICFIAGLVSCTINAAIYFIAVFILFYCTWNHTLIFLYLQHLYILCYNGNMLRLNLLWNILLLILCCCELCCRT